MKRFWSKVDTRGDCWLWTGHILPNGYGTFFLHGKKEYAHRVALKLTTGELEPTEQVDHKCHTKACVRPAHIRATSPKQNRENLNGAYKNSKSGVRGVSWSKSCNKWHAQVRHNGKQHHVGLFDDLEEASVAVTAVRNMLFTHNDRDKSEETLLQLHV